METEGYGGAYENVSIVGGVITTGGSVGAGVSSGASLQNGAGLLPKSTSTEGVVGLAKKPVPKPRRISLLTTSEMAQAHGSVGVIAGSTAPAAAAAEPTKSKAVADCKSGDSPEMSPKRSPENAASGESYLPSFSFGKRVIWQKS